MLKANPGVRYPGAFFVASDVVTEGECCLGQSVAELAAICVTVGAAYSIAGGEIFMEITTPDLLDECQGEAPTVTAMLSTDVEDGTANSFTCTNNGAAEGEVWIGDAATWAGSVLKVEQTVDIWTDGEVDFTPVQGAFPESPPAAYLYVMNACGRPNAVGFEVAWVEV